MLVLYEDNAIIVVIKPHNQPSQEDESGDVDLLSEVKSYIKEKYNKPGEAFVGLVHRLDRPVEGIMVFARSSKAAARLSDQIKKHEFNKHYLNWETYNVYYGDNLIAIDATTALNNQVNVVVIDGDKCYDQYGLLVHKKPLPVIETVTLDKEEYEKYTKDVTNS